MGVLVLVLDLVRINGSFGFRIFPLPETCNGANASAHVIALDTSHDVLINLSIIVYVLQDISQKRYLTK